MFKNLFSDRKGSITDSVVIVALIFVLAFVVVLSGMVLNEIEAANTQLPAWSLNEAQSALGVFDVGIALLTGVLYMVSMILAFRIRTNPVFLVPALIFNGLALFISAEFSNVFWKIVNVGGAFTTAANDFPVLLDLMKNLPVVVGGLNFLLIIVIFVGPFRSARRVQV